MDLFSLFRSARFPSQRTRAARGQHRVRFRRPVAHSLSLELLEDRNLLSVFSFDFGTATSPVATGSTRVTETTAYNAAQGYGWQTSPVFSVDRAVGGDLARDFNFVINEGTFAVDVPNGTYDLTLLQGDSGLAYDQMGIFLEGVLRDTVSTALNEFVSRNYTVNVTDGQLNLLLRDLGGQNPLALINALTITSSGGGSQSGSLQFSAATAFVAETGGNALITVTRSGGSAGTVTVNYATSPGSATANQDYLSTSGTLTFLSGEASKTFTVTIVDDSDIEGNETVNLSLSNPTGGATLGSPSTAVLTIVDNEVAQAGSVQFSAATYSVNENDGSAIITVHRTGSTGTVTVNVALSDGSATAGQDYFTTSGKITFLPGEVSKTFTVSIFDDSLVEGNETVILTLSGPTGGATLGVPSTGVLTIVDNDVAQAGSLQFSAANYSVNENGGSASITVTRTGSSSGTVSVTVAASGGNATNGADYFLPSTTLTFLPGEVIKTFTILIIDDLLVEGNETVNLSLSNPTGGATLGFPSTAVLTIVDNDFAQVGSVQFSAATYSANENAGAVSITVTRTGNTSGTASVNFTTSDGSALAGQDYFASSGTLTFFPGEVSKTFTVFIFDDSLVEGNETVNLTLSNASGATLVFPSTAVLTIVDNDVAQASSIQFSAANYSVNENAGAAVITVTRTGSSSGTVSVNVATSGGTATNGADYFLSSGMLTFFPGEVSKTFTVSIFDDLLVEGNETVNLSLSSPTGGATLGFPSSAVLTIVDNDFAQVGGVQFSAATYSVNENAGAASITVTRTGNTSGTASVNFTTSDGSALAGQDYFASSGTLTFFPGEVSKTFTVFIFDDSLVEGNETVNLSLSNPTGGATLGFPSTAVLTIIDNDVVQASSVQFSTATFSGNENGGSAAITVTRTGSTSSTVSVNFATSDGSALAGQDYGQTFGTLTFFPAETSKTFTVAIFDDLLVEGNETVNLTLSNPSGGATLGFPSTAVLTIVDNDFAQVSSVQFSAATYSVNENGGSAAIAVTRTGSSGTVSVTVAASGGSATNGADYFLSSTTLTFFPGEVSKTFTVVIFDDLLVEGNETVNLSLSNPSGGVTLGFPSTAVLTIVDNDFAQVGGVQFGAATYTVNENAGAASITVTRTGTTSGTASVNFTTSDGSAVAGQDYFASSGTLTFFPGEVSKTFSVFIFDDSLVEGNETVNLTLSNPGGAALGFPSTAVLTIVDNDFAQASSVQFGTTTFSVNENGGSAAITVTRTGSSSGTVSVNFTTSDGSAVAGQDYFASSGTLTFFPGEVSKTFTVFIFDDSQVEGNETVNLTLSNPSGGAALGFPSTAVLTIVDNDFAQASSVQFGTTTFSVNENGGSAAITVTRTGSTTGTVSVNFTTSDGTAVAGQDYGQTFGTLTFFPGEVSKTFTVSIFDDLLVEGNETVNLTLSNPAGGATLGFPSTAVLTIVDNDFAQVSSVQFSAATYSVNENGGSATITVTRTGSSSGTVSVTVTASGGTATNGADYFLSSTTLTFFPGEVTKTFTVVIFDDLLVEGNETVNLSLSNPSGAALGFPSTAVLTIVDNDFAQVGGVQFGAATYSVNENAGAASITVTRTGNTSNTVSVNFTTSDGSALAGQDYGQTFGTLTFFPGEVSKTFTVSIFDDLLVEGNETVNLTLSNPSGTTLGFPSTAVLTIVDNDFAQVSSLQFSTTTSSVNENGGSAAITVTRTGSTTGTVSVNFTTSDGTAVAGQDYGQTFGTLTFFPGEVSKTFTVSIFDDLLVEGNETVNLTLSNPTGGATLGFPSTAVLTIVDNDFAQVSSVQFSAASYSVNENGGSATITATRTGGSGGTVSVNFATSDGSASAGSDYLSAFGTLTFFPGEVSKTFTVSILDDSQVEGTETVNLALGSPTGGATLGFPSTAVLTIVDNDVAQPGSLQFSAATYSVNENGGSAQITVSRVGGSAGTVSVNIATSDGSASAGLDYLQGPGTLFFFNLEVSKTFPVFIVNDTQFEGNETVNLTLSSPTGGATLGSPSTAVLTIVDDDPAQPGILQFSAAVYNVTEDGGSATITVSRTGGSDGTVSVNYATSNGSATAGQDYVSAFGTLTFANGEVSKTFTVTIREDIRIEGNESVNLTLSNPTGGATLGSLTAALLRIVDNDTATSPKQFDFGTATSPVAAGHIQVTEASLVNAAQGFGWSADSPVYSRDREAGTALTRDLNFAVNQATFLVDVPNGTYQVALVIGDRDFSYDQVGIFLEGVQVGTVTVVNNQFATPTFTVNVTDGQLTLLLKDLGGSNSLVVINALTITVPGFPAGGFAPEDLDPEPTTPLLLDGVPQQLVSGTTAAASFPLADLYAKDENVVSASQDPHAAARARSAQVIDRLFEDVETAWQGLFPGSSDREEEFSLLW